MEGVVVTQTANNNNNNSRLKSRVRNNLARNSKNRQINRNNNNINHHYKNNSNRNNKTTIRSNSFKNNGHKHLNNINNKNLSKNNGNDLQDNLIFSGEFTKEVYNAICPRIGHTLHIPEDSVQALLNDMHLYPSKAQVTEMLQCARQCGGRNGTSKYITFGEFCVFVREMQNFSNLNKQQHRKLSHCNNKCLNNCEVFLGGSCNPTTWRTDTAIPELQKYGISFYNPQVSMWVPELVAQERDAKQSASVLLFVVDSQTRSVGGMIEVAYLVASGRCVVLVAQAYRPEQSIMGEKITQREYMDLVDGQNSLLMLVKSRGIKIHASLPAALQCTASILRNSSTTEEQLTSKLRRLREVFDSYGSQNDEISFVDMLDAFQKLTKRELKISELFDYFRSSNDANLTNMNISFERFCMLIAEFTTDRCNNTTNNDGRFSNRLYWSCALLKTRHLLKSYVVQPVTSALVWASQPFQRQCSANNNSCNTTPLSHIQENNKKATYNNVFLGGSNKCQKNWKRDIAIPLLKKHGITYYNPAIREEQEDNFDIIYNEKDVFEWKQSIEKSRILLFVITNDTISLTTMIMAAYYMGLGKNMVLCIQQLPDNCVISNEILTSQAVKDYNRGRVYLADFAKQKQIPVFDNITEAVQNIVDNFYNQR